MHVEIMNKMLNYFGVEPNEEQLHAMKVLSEFSTSTSLERNVILLKGYAGTGKTSLTGSFVKSLRENKQRVVLLAPTGRAAKVLAKNASFSAFTIHKYIYRKQVLPGGGITLVVGPNLFKNCTFIVDEASMIADYSTLNDGTVSSRNLLDDLMEFVFQHSTNRLIFIGDEGQLPPVGSDFSPTLNLEYMQNHFFGVNFQEILLTQVHRQTEDSLILKNASLMRIPFFGSEFPKLTVDKNLDVIAIDGISLQEELENAYNKFGIEETLFITKSNKKAAYYNQQIRNRILWFEEDLCKNDWLMVVKNNYFWLEEQSAMGFIANGEICRVVRLGKREFKYEHQFVWATVEFVDHPEMGEVDLLLLMDLLQTEETAMSRKDLKQLFFNIEEEYIDEKNKKKRYEKVMKSPYFNALQVKFSYAITCHKSQGGQWDVVFVDHGYIMDEFEDPTLNRWLYTSFTRSKEKLYLVGFDERFYDEK